MLCADIPNFLRIYMYILIMKFPQGTVWRRRSKCQHKQILSEPTEFQEALPNEVTSHWSIQRENVHRKIL